MNVDDATLAVLTELKKAMDGYPKMASEHEGWAVILEELDELWDEIKKSPKNLNKKAMKAEAVQVCAMAMRFLVDRC
jgi:hypothetical protein